MLARVICPQCGNVFDLAQAWDDEEARRFVELLSNFPPSLIKPFYCYIKLFKPSKQVLRWGRVLKITRELDPMIKEGYVLRNGSRFPVSTAMWEAAFSEMQHKCSLTLPLANHGYLLEMLSKQANKVAAIAEEELEVKRRQGQHRASHAVTQDKGLQPVAAVVTKPKSLPPVDWQGALSKVKKED
jgi:hypothetical protein